MRKLATFCWSLSVGAVGFFVGLIFLGSYHTFDNWQVVLGGFIVALVLAVPTGYSVSRVSATASPADAKLLAIAGMLFALALVLLLSRSAMFQYRVA